MMPKPGDRVIAVRVGTDAATVTVAVRNDGTLRRLEEIRLPGGLSAIDARLRTLVLAEMPDEMSAGYEAAEPDTDRRLDIAIPAVRSRLVSTASTIVSVRLGPRLTFVTLDRDAVVTALRPESDAVVGAIHQLARGQSIDVMALDGVEAVPGLLAQLPGRLVDAEEWDDTEPARGGSELIPELASASPAVVRRPWPWHVLPTIAAAGVLVIVAWAGWVSATSASGRDNVVRVSPAPVRSTTTPSSTPTPPVASMPATAPPATVMPPAGTGATRPKKAVEPGAPPPAQAGPVVPPTTPTTDPSPSDPPATPDPVPTSPLSGLLDPPLPILP